jgi:hypothetical protein
MKALQINAEVLTTTGLNIPAGAVVVINEFLTQSFQEKKGSIPVQIGISTFVNKEAYESGKSEVATVASYNQLITCDVTPDEYSTIPCETLAIMEVQDVLEFLYPGNVVVIDVVKPTV